MPYSECPYCGYKNYREYLTNEAYITQLEQDLENATDDAFNLKNTIAYLKTKPPKALCEEQLQVPIHCENPDCNESYTISESKNWNQIQAELDI